MKVKGYSGYITEYDPMTIEELKAIPSKIAKIKELQYLYEHTDYSNVKAINYEKNGSHSLNYDKQENFAIYITEEREKLYIKILELINEIYYITDNAVKIIGFIVPSSEKQAEFLMNRYIECKTIDEILKSMDNTDRSSFYKLQKRALASFEKVQEEHKKLYPEE